MVLSFQNSRKGNAIFDSLTILIVIFMMAIFSIIGYMVFDITNTDMQSDSDLSATAKAVPNNLFTKYADLFDNMILFAFVLFLMFTIISVFMLDTHPIFFIVAVMLLIGVFVTSMLLGNVYEDLMSEDSFSSYANQFIFTTWVMNHILELIVGSAFIIVIALFAKMKG